jgi:hypothetical protein
VREARAFFKPRDILGKQVWMSDFELRTMRVSLCSASRVAAATVLALRNSACVLTARASGLQARIRRRGSR